MRLGGRTSSPVFLGATVVALTTVLSMLAPGHAAAPIRSAAPATRAAPEVVPVEYGDIVRVPVVDANTGAVTLRFDGRRGKRVALTTGHVEADCQRATLSRRGHRVSRDALGFWRLPRTGTYQLRFTHHCTQVSPGGAKYVVSAVIAVHRLVIHRGEVGRWLDTRSAGPTMHAYRVPVPRREGGVSVEGTDDYHRPDVARASRLKRSWSSRTNGSEWCRPTYVLGSIAMGSAPNRWECAWTMPRRDDYLVTGDAPVRIRPFAYSDAAVDGPATRWTGDAPRIVTFRAKAGSYIRISAANLDIHPPPAVPNDIAQPPVYRTFGKSLEYAAGFFDADARVHHLLLRVTRSGRQAINLYEARVRDASTRVSVRVRSVSHTVVQPGVPTPIRVDGDRWAVATLPPLVDVAPHSLGARFSVLSTAGVAEGWTGYLMGARGPYGTADDAKRLLAALTASGTSDWIPLESRDLNGVVVEPAPGSTSGTVTAQLDTRSPDQ